MSIVGGRPPCYLPRVDLLVLGPLELRADGASIPIRRGRPRRLFLSLLLRAGRPVGADTLIDELWGEEIPEAPQWTLTDASLIAEAAAGTEFWSRTHCGFTRHDGHLFAARVTELSVAAVCGER